MARLDNRQISDQEKEEVRRLNPVDEVIRGYGIDLRPEGARLKGLCPFHPDHNHPNLTVSADRLWWKCFRCDAWGDVYEFIERREGVDFPEAFRRLRARSSPGSAANVGSPREQRVNPSPAFPQQAPHKPWDRLTLPEQGVMNTTLVIYRQALWQQSEALNYLRRRGLPDGIIRQCGLGYADGHSLELEMRRTGNLHIAEQLGLLRPARTGSGHRELLAGRIVVPELRGGQCIWLIGRALQEDSDRPKYLALPGERPVLGFERAAGHREAFLCEGVFDYLTAVTWNLAACSFCGTALPDDRLGFLASARTLYGLFDPDAAGQAASERAQQQLGDRFRPVVLPEGHDLNDLGSVTRGRATFFRLLEEVRKTARPGCGEAPPVIDEFKKSEVTYAHSH